MSYKQVEFDDLTCNKIINSLTKINKEILEIDGVSVRRIKFYSSNIITKLSWDGMYPKLELTEQLKEIKKNVKFISENNNDKSENIYNALEELDIAIVEIEMAYE